MLDISRLDGTLLSSYLVCPPTMVSYAGVVDSDSLVASLFSCPLFC